MNYRITYTVLAFDFYLELKFAKKKITLYLRSNKKNHSNGSQERITRN